MQRKTKKRKSDGKYKKKSGKRQTRHEHYDFIMIGIADSRL